MKITHISTVHNRHDNRIFHKQCSDLVNLCDEINLIVSDGQGEEKRNGVNIFDTKKNYLKSRFLRILFQAPLTLIYSFKNKSDIYHLHDPELLIHFYYLRFFFKRLNIIYDMHENLPASILSKIYIPKIFRRILSKLWKNFEEIALQYVNVIFAEDSYQNNYSLKKKSEIVRNFPKNFWFETKKIVSEKKSIGYLGVCTKDRGIVNLLVAVKNLNNQNIELKVELIGDVWEGISDLDIFKSLEDQKILKYHGFLSNESASKIVKNWDIGFAVLKKDPNFFDSYPTKLFEYLAASIPVITSDFPLYKKIISEFNGGICIEPENEEILEMAIKKIILNKDNFIPKYHAKEYRWENEFKKMFKFYKEIQC